MLLKCFKLVAVTEAVSVQHAHRQRLHKSKAVQHLGRATLFDKLVAFSCSGNTLRLQNKAALDYHLRADLWKETYVAAKLVECRLRNKLLSFERRCVVQVNIVLYNHVKH